MTLPVTADHLFGSGIKVQGAAPETRFAAVGLLGLGLLTSRVYHGPDAMRYAGMTLCLVFLLGLAALPFAPETKGKPLPA